MKVECWSWQKRRFGAPGRTLRRVVGEMLGKMGKAWTLMSTGACWGKCHQVLEVTTEHNGSSGEFDLKIDVWAKNCQKH